MPAQPAVIKLTVTNRIWREFYANNLTRTDRDVGLMLLGYLGSDGLCYPSHATIAERVNCCVRSVQRGLEQLSILFLVDKTARYVKRGWRWVRTSNAHKFFVPEREVEPGSRRIRKRVVSTGLAVRGDQSLKIQEVQTLYASALDENASLEARVAAVEKQLLAERARPMAERAPEIAERLRARAPIPLGDLLKKREVAMAKQLAATQAVKQELTPLERALAPPQKAELIAERVKKRLTDDPGFATG